MLSMHSYLRVVDESVGSIVEPVSEEGFLSVEVSIDVYGTSEEPNSPEFIGKPRSI
jgi:hypothetical protein